MKKKLNEVKDHVMAGISYALPVVISGSLIIGVVKVIALFGGVTDLQAYADGTGIFNALCRIENVGWMAIGMLNMVLGGFIAYSISGKAGLAAGFIGGQLATTTGSGFLGAVVAGLFAGYMAELVKNKIRITGSASAMVPLILLPLITVGLQAILMVFLVGEPLGWANQAMLNWVQEMTQSNVNVIVLAFVMGGMIGFDMGGPVNKASWAAANALFISGEYLPTILTNAAIFVTPVGYGMATLLRPKNFSDTFREAGKGAIIMGILGISEGAIPFTLVSPLKLIPLNVIASGTASAIAAALGVYAIMPPIGGMWGFFTVGNWWAFLIGGWVGIFMIAIGANILVDFNDKETAHADVNDDDTIEEAFEIEFEEL